MRASGRRRVGALLRVQRRVVHGQRQRHRGALPRPRLEREAAAVQRHELADARQGEVDAAVVRVPQEELAWVRLQQLLHGRSEACVR